jgi:hypothetical protein
MMPLIGETFRAAAPVSDTAAVDGGERHGLVWKDLAPVAEWLIGGDQHGAPLVARFADACFAQEQHYLSFAILRLRPATSGSGSFNLARGSKRGGSDYGRTAFLHGERAIIGDPGSKGLLGTAL